MNSRFCRIIQYSREECVRLHSCTKFYVCKQNAALINNIKPKFLLIFIQFCWFNQWMISVLFLSQILNSSSKFLNLVISYSNSNLKLLKIQYRSYLIKTGCVLNLIYNGEIFDNCQKIIALNDKLCSVSKGGSVTHQMAVPVPSISCCVLKHPNIFYQIPNALAFNWDTCCNPALCLRLLPLH
jgi:hypothetical protein